MEPYYKNTLKAKTSSLELIEIEVLQGQKIVWPSTGVIQNNSLLYVLSGELLQPNKVALNRGGCIALNDLEALSEFRVSQSTRLLLITSPQNMNESNTPIHKMNPSSDARVQCGRAIALSIQKAETIHASEVDALLSTLNSRAPFEGDLLNRYTELYLSVLSELPLEPLRLSKSYCARICGHWTLSHEASAETFHGVIAFIAKLYNELFLPNCQVKLVQEAIELTLTNTTEKKTVQYISDKLFVNRTHLSERFKQLTGISLSAYITRVKMYGAMLLLLDNTLSLSDVLDILGYKDEQHFNNNFKKNMGYTPSEYVRRFNGFSK